MFNLIMDQLVSLPLPDDAQLLSYADDLALVVSGEVGNKIEVAQKSLNMIADKCADLGLKISAGKSKAMLVKPKPKEPPPIRRLIIQGTQLEWVKTYQYLGVWIDDKLTFYQHLSYLKERMRARTTVMRAMTRTDAGASSAVLKLYYTMAVRPLLDYCAPVLVNINKDQRDRLEVSQNNALRLILGAAPWTKTETLQCEAGLIPLTERIKQLTAGKVANLLQRSPDTAARRCLGDLEDHSLRHTKWLKKTAKCATVLISSWAHLVADSDLPDPRYKPPPPWSPHAIKFYSTTLPGTKATCTPIEMRQHTLSWIEQLHVPGSEVYFTDGSVDPDKTTTGSAFTTRQDTVAWRNSDHCSTLQTELVAIQQALEHGMGGNASTIIIHTDSKGAMQSLQRRHHKDNVRLITSILGLAQMIKSERKNIFINWIPSHVGIQGNEKADTAARGATAFPNVTYHLRQSLHQTRIEIKNRIKKITLQNHQQLHTTSTSMAWYAAATAFEQLDPTFMKIRRQSVALHRIRLGYKCYAEIFPERGQWSCNHCRQTSEHPLLHYLLNCRATAELRELSTSEDTTQEDEKAAAVVKKIMDEPERWLSVIKNTPPPR